MKYGDNELTNDELMEVTAGIRNGRVDEMLNKLDRGELKDFRNFVSKDKELTLDELDNVKAGIPQEMIENNKEENKDIFRKM